LQVDFIKRKNNMAGAALEARSVSHHRKPDTYVGRADHRFGNLVGSQISRYFEAPIVYHSKADRFVVHVLDEEGVDGTTVVMQRVQVTGGEEEMLVGFISGKPYHLRSSNEEKDSFHQGLALIMQDGNTAIAPFDLKIKLLNDHPFLRH
jgi:hypothetical protein